MCPIRGPATLDGAAQKHLGDLMHHRPSRAEQRRARNALARQAAIVLIALLLAGARR